MNNNFVAVGGLNQMRDYKMRDYKEEYIKTLEALVELQRELIDTLNNRPAPIWITYPVPTINLFAPINPFAPMPTYPVPNFQTGSTCSAITPEIWGPEFAG